MNIDIRLKNNFFRHPKTKKLEAELGKCAPLYLIKIWIFASEFFPDGILKNIDGNFLENEVGWPENKEKSLIQTLENIGFIEKDGPNLIIHDWFDHNSYASESNNRVDKGRFSKLKQLFPDTADYLKSIGITSISKENYQKIASAAHPLEMAKSIFNGDNGKRDKKPITKSKNNPTGYPQGTQNTTPQGTHRVDFSSNTNTNSNSNLKKDIKNISHTKYSDNTKSEPQPKPVRYERENPKGNIPDPENDFPSMEFVEFRDFYDRNVKPEGSHAGWIEFKKIKKASGPRGLEYFPGIHALMDDISKRLEDGFWDKGYEPSMAKYLNDRTWNQEVTSRQKPESERRDQKTFAQIEEERERERKQRLREKIRAMQEEGEKNAGL